MIFKKTIYRKDFRCNTSKLHLVLKILKKEDLYKTQMCLHLYLILTIRLVINYTLETL